MSGLVDPRDTLRAALHVGVMWNRDAVIPANQCEHILDALRAPPQTVLGLGVEDAARVIYVAAWVVMLAERDPDFARSIGPERSEPWLSIARVASFAKDIDAEPPPPTAGPYR